MNKSDKLEIIELINSFETAAEELRKIIESPETPEKWEPKGGDYRVRTFASCSPCHDSDITFSEVNNGYRYKTEKQARQAQKFMNSTMHLYALAEELNDGWEPDWTDKKQRKCYIQYKPTNQKFSYTFWRTLQVYAPYFSEPAAKRAVEMLNSGEVEL